MLSITLPIESEYLGSNKAFMYYYNNLDYLCKALKNRHFRGYGQPNLLPIYYFCGKSLDMRSTARASRPDGAAHR